MAQGWRAREGGRDFFEPALRQLPSAALNGKHTLIHINTERSREGQDAVWPRRSEHPLLPNPFSSGSVRRGRIISGTGTAALA